MTVDLLVSVERVQELKEESERLRSELEDLDLQHQDAVNHLRAALEGRESEIRKLRKELGAAGKGNQNLARDLYQTNCMHRETIAALQEALAARSRPPLQGTWRAVETLALLAGRVVQRVREWTAQNRVFVAYKDGTYTCPECTPLAVDLSVEETWELYSEGWVRGPVCRECRLALPVYLLEGERK